jgi:hypothetical protein
MRHLEIGIFIVVLGWMALLMGREAEAQVQQVAPVAYVAPAPKGRDVTQWPVPRQQSYLSAQRAMDWLRRTNKPDGRFVYGFLPALCVPMAGDDYIAQAGATFALARAARYFGDEASTAVARQAILTLLLETTTDPQSPHERYTAAPPAMLDRVAGSSVLLLAIHELTAPGKDLLEQGDQLANYLRRQQRYEGALTATVDSAGRALHGIMKSQVNRPAAWKAEMVRKACGHYLAQWQQAKSLPVVVSHTPAYAEAYLCTKDRLFADAVFAMNDWLCTLQIAQTTPARKQSDGGFPTWMDGPETSVSRLAQVPDIRSAVCAESLAEACRVARAANDLPRYQRYGQALEQCLQFVQTLQYVPARTRHFADDFRPAVLGGFFASPQDGNLRLDYTEHALSALVLYLENLGD